MKPLKNNLIIKPIKLEQKTDSGIILGFQDGQSQLLRQIYPNIATVLQIHPDDQQEFAVNEIVVFLRWGARELNGSELLVINKKDIIGKINEKS
jgi:co-chaperonin GroES (HSP10)